MTAWAILENYFGSLTPAEVASELAPIPPRGATPASSSAVAYLDEQGGPELDGEVGPGDIAERRAVVAARSLADLMRSAYTLEETAAALAVSRSRVSHRLGDGTLWAFTVQGRRFVPRWQIDEGGRTIPGLASVLKAIPRGMHPLALEGFMTSPQDEFDGASPSAWLRSGGDSALVVGWLAGMAYV